MDLDSVRKKIDAIDEQVLQLLNERIRNAAEIGRIKREHGAQIYVASREEQVLKKLSALNLSLIHI